MSDTSKSQRHADSFCIRVWVWADAPEKYRRLSRHGGDEDWVAYLPPEYKGELPLWMESGTAFGCCSVQTTQLPGGYTIAIGAHS